MVKAISHDRTFGRAVDKSIRVLKEIRIRGVKTNIPFLINVLNNETFREGRCYTTFIEETPELFLLPESQDRATNQILKQELFQSMIQRRRFMVLETSS